jgi:hypothetical protein
MLLRKCDRNEMITDKKSVLYVSNTLLKQFIKHVF